MAESRERLAATFDQASALYHRARPDYPDRLFDDLIARTGLGPGDQVLEIGCGTGKATLPLARRGLRVTGIEPGPALATVARENLAGFPGVGVVEGRFEEWSAPAGEVFDAVVAATSWHWIDPSVRYRRTWELLRPGGHLAYWSATHVFPDGGDPFFVEIQPVYEEIGEGLPPGAGRPRPGEVGDDCAEIEASGFFEPVEAHQFDWETVYDADGYLALLDTFSGHIVMGTQERERLYGEVRRRLACRPEGMLRRHWGAVLHIARRRDRPVTT